MNRREDERISASLPASASHPRDARSYERPRSTDRSGINVSRRPLRRDVAGRIGAWPTALARWWLLVYSFAPPWLPACLQRPGFSYLCATLIGVATVLLTHLLSVTFPVPLPGIVPNLGIVLVALACGTGASLVTTLVSAILLEVLVLTPHLTWSITAAENLVALVLFIGVGAVVSVLASQTERARRHAQRWAIRERAARRRMDMFLGVTSHELRTPLAGAKASLQLAQRLVVRLAHTFEVNAGESEVLARVDQLLAQVDRQLGRQDRLVAGLLDVSCIQAGELELRAVRCDVSTI
jgi:K+-sensing histidine kinase KdpD